MLNHLTEPTNIRAHLLKKRDHYECPECLIHYTNPPQFCWFCGVVFTEDKPQSQTK